MQDSETPATPGTGPSVAPACTLVVFGAKGDLTQRLLMPALYNLAGAGHLPAGFRVVGVDHNENTDAGWREALTETMQGFTRDDTAEFHPDRIDEATWRFVCERLRYHTGDFDAPETYRALDGILDGSAIFYLAVSARFFGPVIDHLGAAGLLDETDGRFRRVVVEKPFGSDLASARALNARILKSAREEQIFRIDHFLGKETVQGILALRFANRLIEPAWTGEHIDFIEITAAETIGVEGRARFYETTGALRDMVPNHLFQLLCMIAMEAPASLDAEAVRDAKAALIAAIRPPVGDAVRGQYGAGREDGRPVPGYRDEADVAAGSLTETYVALSLAIDTPRWQGVPFYLRTGKRLARRRTEIAIHFKRPHAELFGVGAAPNVLRLFVDPGSGLAGSLNVKRPGPAMALDPAVATLNGSADALPGVGYESLLFDAMKGDGSLFQRADMIEGAWAVVDSLIAAWKDAPVADYPAGSDGPVAADTLLNRRGHAWTPLPAE
ncbi:glucose-6-phosphate dehydrogenase [Methylobacterium sp. Leaf108]|uniref:glucose-6-phosphate dehydrogenase n=1 Tax=Methylobacterium sp. Leaf108 TaxID=1736256 RepID=UPI0006FB4E7B|nr:glucose-6-phosphate dehydrogenase [Methylobacterium sp. Leaf108]KQP50351.1 glucose-6-phosphate dehydrogenase [Methylobacterium sp. Leaf108]